MTLVKRATRKVAVKSATTPKKKFTKFRPQVFSRHPSHSPLRRELPLLPFRSVVRLGSTTVSNRPDRVECNSVQGVINSSSKLRMKQCFKRAGVRTAEWYTITNFNGSYQVTNESNSTLPTDLTELPYPIIAKSHHGSRGEGNTKIDSLDQMKSWLRGKTLNRYIFERFYSYNREYRLHVTNNGCFYTCRKMLKQDTPDTDKWHRHDSNSVWIVDTNPQFDKPNNWEEIVKDCIDAKNALGLDICAFDVKVQSSTDSRGRRRESPDWIIIESCSAPSFGDITKAKYLEEIPKILKAKYERR